MSRRMVFAITLIGINALILMLVPRPVVAQTTWGCGYVACGTTDSGHPIYRVCFSDGGANVCGCACFNAGAGGE
jgi:hypothetical protein